MVYPRKETTTSFSTDTHTVDKTDKFDISANLKMDFMSKSLFLLLHCAYFFASGGQVKVSGAMKYLTDESSSEKEVGCTKKQ